jgi:carboxypeptidase Q
LKGLKFDAVRIEEVKSARIGRGLYDAAEIVSPVPFKLYVAALGGSGPTPKGGITAPLVRFTDLNGLRAAAPETVIKGRLSFIDEPTVRTQDGSGYSVGVVKRGLCGPIAQSMGAVGCLIRSVGTHMHRFPIRAGQRGRVMGRLCRWRRCRRRMPSMSAG